MKPYLIFVSSTQKELQKERIAVREFIRKSDLLDDYFDVFLFEKTPARDKAAEREYLKKVEKCDIYLGILGNEYGVPGTDGLSPVEREFCRATEKGKERLIYIKGKADSGREEKMRSFIKRISAKLIRKRFKDTAELLEEVNRSLIDFLKDRGHISTEPFDTLLCLDASYEDINEKLVKAFLANRAKKRKSPALKTSVKDFLLKTIRVIKDKDGSLKPANVALLFFSDHPQKFIPQSSIKVARFKGITRVKFLDSQEIQGDIYKILAEVGGFIERNTRLASKIVGFKRVDIPEYPHEAIREAVINAIAHRDYFRTGSHVQIDIFDDRIEVTNPGGLLPGLDINKLEGVHETRNRKICSIFHETHDMEKYGTGIAKMNLSMKEHGLNPPVLSQPGGFFRVTFYSPGENILDLVSNIPDEQQVDLRRIGLNRRQIEALTMMINEGAVITNREYRDLFKVSNKTAATDLSALVKKDLATSRGRGRNVSYFCR